MHIAFDGLCTWLFLPRVNVVKFLSDGILLWPLVFL